MIHVVNNVCGLAAHQLYERQMQLLGKTKKTYPVEFLHYTFGEPETLPESVREREKVEGFSYLSKFYALRQAIESTGANQFLWVDATIWLKEGWDSVVSSYFEQDGLFLINQGCAKEWTSDRFLSLVSKNREDFNIDLVTGGVFGFDLDHKNGRAFWDKICEYMEVEDMWFGPCGMPHKMEQIGTPELSLDPNVKGHRHDQCVMGWVAHQLDLPFAQDGCKGPHFYSQSYLHDIWAEWKKHVDRYGLGTEVFPAKKITFPKNAAMTHHPTRYHFNNTIPR